jgi:lipopolysaccharide transport system permease protein
MSSPLPVRVITPQAGLAGFREAFLSLFTAWTTAGPLAWRFFLRDTRAAHRQSLLGYFWVILPPLANTLVWVFLNNGDVVRIDSGNVPYPIFVLAGTILWASFNGSLVAMLGTINDGKGLLSKINFPQESLVYKSFLKSLVEGGIPALLLIPAIFFYGIGWHIGILLFPLSVIASLLLGSAIGLILAPITALYHDVSRGMQLILRFGFFLTPVIFPLPAAGMPRLLMLINPVTPILVSGRAWLTGSGEAMPVAFLVVVMICLALLAFGLVIYKVVLPTLIERLSS